MTKRILVLPGDGIGPETTAEAVKVLRTFQDAGSLDIEISEALIGGAAIEAYGTPLPEDTLAQARESDAVLLGAIGGPKWDDIERELRPERGLLGIRAGLGVFANLRPAIMFPQLAEASSLKPQLISKLNIMIVRELTGGIYFGEPRGIRTLGNGERQGFNTMVYQESEIERICRVGFEIASLRGKKVCSVEKANVLEVSELWREVATRVAADYPGIEYSNMYVDNAAMQLVRAPKQFDVIVTGNLFGDILSDMAAMLTGSIGMLPSASLDETGKGLYEPVHGSAPDIAGKGIANPLATILSAAMMLRYSLKESGLADRVNAAISSVLDAGICTADLDLPNAKFVRTSELGDAVVAAL